ncbi:unnamed protein product, partial [Mesorhabditis belari]|uniref:Uncharacterized protein n=1 Tax=Mesorhabditis belari TaxID=2138241 RepID=A0AAF3J4T2_9BILA
MDFAQVSIAIVVMVLDEENNENYRLAVNSIRCYAEVQNYTYIYIDYSKNETLQRMCPQKDFLFARHCVMIDLMKREQFEFFLFFGADNGVINPLRRIEEYLPVNPFVNILFYQRFYNDEIMADSYLIRNTQQSLDFLQLWVDYYDRTKNFECSGTDNGAIQSVVIEFFAPEFNASMAICKREWSRGSKYAHLFRYEACAQYLLSLLPESELNKRGFHLFQKGQGWSRDGWVTATKWCQRDLFFHGWKKEKLGSEWELPFSSWNRFDQKCEKGEFSRWRYRSEFKVPCLEIDFRLHQYFSEKRLLYYKALQEILLIFANVVSILLAEDQLLLVQTVWRHGDRTPVWSYPSDPLKDYKWPVKPGELTPRGFDQQRHLGAAFRERYINGPEPFLSSVYSPKEVFIRSTNVSRTIASAKANMLGFFPNDIEADLTMNLMGTNEKTTIPIHVNNLDTDFAGFVPLCPNFERDLKNYLPITDLQKVYQNHKAVIDLVVQKTGISMDFETFEPYMVYDLLHIQREIYHLRTPDWATPQVMYELKQLTIWKIDSYLGYADPPSVNITRYRGEILKEMLDRMQQKITCHQNGNKGAQCATIGDLKFYAYSAHDITVAGLLATLGSYMAVPGRFLRYTVCATLELWLRDGKPYVKVLLRPTRWSSFHTFTQFTTGCPPGAEFCPFDIFLQRSAPYLPADIKKDCGVS